MARRISTRPRHEEAEMPQIMHWRRPTPVYPSPILSARQQGAIPASCTQNQTPTTSIYTITTTRTLPFSTSTFQRFVTDSQSDKTTTITQTIVEAGQRTTAETLPITTTFCVSRPITSAPTATSSVVSSISITPSLTSSSSVVSTSSTLSTPSSSPPPDPTASKSNKTPAIIAAAVVPVVVFIIVMGIFNILRAKKGKKQRRQEEAAREVALEESKAEDEQTEADRIKRAQTQEPINVPLRGGYAMQDMMNRGRVPGHYHGGTVTGRFAQYSAHQRGRHQQNARAFSFERIQRNPVPTTGNEQHTALQHQQGPPGLFQTGERERIGPIGYGQETALQPGGRRPWGEVRRGQVQQEARNHHEGPPAWAQQSRPQAVVQLVGLQALFDSATTLNDPPVAPSTVDPDDSISVVQGTSNPETVDHSLDDTSQIEKERDRALAALEGLVPEKKPTDRQFGSQISEAEEMLIQMKRVERARRHRSNQRKEVEWLRRQQEWRRRHAHRRNLQQMAGIRGLGVTDTNQTDFDVDAVNQQQMNQPPRRRPDGVDLNWRPFGASQPTYSNTRIYPPTTANRYQRQEYQGQSSNAPRSYGNQGGNGLAGMPLTYPPSTGYGVYGRGVPQPRMRINPHQRPADDDLHLVQGPSMADQIRAENRVRQEREREMAERHRQNANNYRRPPFVPPQNIIPGYGVYSTSNPDPLMRINTNESQNSQGTSGGAAPRAPTQASRQRREQDDKDQYSWLDLDSSSPGN